MNKVLNSVFLGVITYAIILSVATILQIVGGPLATIAAVLNGLCVFAGGYAAVWSYTLASETPLNKRKRAGIGALVGLVGVPVIYVVMQALIAIGLLPDPMLYIEAQIATLPLDQRQAVQEMVAFNESFLGILFNMGVAAVMSMIGGLLGAFLPKKRQKKQVLAEA